MFKLSDGELTVLVFPQGALEGIDMTAGGGAQVTVPTSKGEQLLVVSLPLRPGGDVPYESELSSFATAIAESS
jgi:hypothetical protein